MYESLRPVARLWYARALGAGPLPPKPRDAPVIRSGDPDADRLLLLGNGPASGWGALTHQLAPVGYLARALTVRTGRAWDADFVGEEQMNAASADAWLGERDLAVYRALVLVLGMNDAVRLTALPDWERDVAALLARLEAERAAAAPIVVAGIPRPSRSTGFAGPFASLADRHADRLNAATERLTADVPGARFLPLQPVASEPLDSSAAHQQLAQQLAGPVEQALAARRPGALAEERAWEWDAAPHIVELARAGGSVALQRIADDAKARFGVQMATISILDGDRLYYTVNTDRLPNSVPRSLSHCQVVVDEDAPLVVPNSKRDPRFRDNPLIDVTHALFYAGFPLHASDGRAVGALCLLNGMPKDERSVPLADLRRFALQAQDELRRLEQEARRRDVQTV